MQNSAYRRSPDDYHPEEKTAQKNTKGGFCLFYSYVQKQVFA
jgi:hypothetical protein